MIDFILLLFLSTVWFFYKENIYFYSNTKNTHQCHSAFIRLEWNDSLRVQRTQKEKNL